MKKRQFEIGIDHAMLRGAKEAFDTCLQAAIRKAIGTGSNEGSAALRISFEILEVMDNETGEQFKRPVMKYKTGYNVPMKESFDATIVEEGRLVHDNEVGYMMVGNQISIDELMAEEEPEAYRGEFQLAEVR